MVYHIRAKLLTSFQILQVTMVTFYIFHPLEAIYLFYSVLHCMLAGLGELINTMMSFYNHLKMIYHLPCLYF